MHRSARSSRPLLPLAAALAAVLAAACGHAPEDATAEEAIAPVDRRPAAQAPAAPAAAKPAAAKPAAAPAHADKAAACDMPSQDCGCDSGAAEAPPEDKIGAEVETIDIRNAPTRGPTDAPVTLVVFSDFECPFCSKLAGSLRQLEDEYPGKLRIAFKHKPLPMHKQARAAARAAMAAHAQGRFWEYHDALFNRSQGALDQAGLERRAADLGLDATRLGRDMRAAKVDALIAADEQEAEQLGLLATPTLFVNGRRLMGAQPMEVLRTAVDRALAGR